MAIWDGINNGVADGVCDGWCESSSTLVNVERHGGYQEQDNEEGEGWFHFLKGFNRYSSLKLLFAQRCYSSLALLFAKATEIRG